MTDRRAEEAKSIFLDALEAPPESREAIVARACGDDAALRAQVTALLRAHAAAEGFLAAPTADAARAARETPTPIPGPAAGDLVGPYRLLEPIGEGGFGTVFLAEQRAPVTRRVAVKVLKAGMDTAQVVARFEAERQALALMDHPGIARVFEAGATDSGRPWFAMEFVAGEPITDWADRRGLDLVERLELLERVCLAVQHAHQKGVIHRDLKPSNVLVTEVDGAAQPKVIDFGVAKAAGATLGAETLTHDRQLVGTPEYMSPEQASFGSASLDTRTDVYSLGVLLHELLVGDVPFGRDRLRRAGIVELQRLVREDDPRRPSAVVAALPPEEARRLAAQRGTAPLPWRRAMIGDLDWIVGMALAKDPDRRYPTAFQLAADLRRHLESQPVLASPPGRLYRAQKFVRRHRAAVLGAGAVVLALAAGIVGIARVASETRREADRAAEVNAFLREVLVTAKPEAGGAATSVLDAVDRAAATVGERFAEHPRQEAEARELIADIAMSQSLHDRAIEHLRRAWEIRTALAGPDAPATVAVGGRLLHAISQRSGADEIESLAADLLPRARRAFGPWDERTLAIRRFFGVAKIRKGEMEAAEAELRPLLEECEQHLGPAHATTVNVLMSLTQALAAQVHDLRSDRADAIRAEIIALLREGAARQTSSLGADDVSTLGTRLQLADALFDAGAFAESGALAADVVARSEGRVADQHWLRIGAYRRLAMVRHVEERFDEAADWTERTIDLYRESRGDGAPMTLAAMNDGLPTLLVAGRDAAGAEFSGILVARFAAFMPPEHDLMRRYRAYHAWFLVGVGRIDEAESILAGLDVIATPLGAGHDRAVLHLARGRRLAARGSIDAARREAAAARQAERERAEEGWSDPIALLPAIDAFAARLAAPEPGAAP